MDLLDKQIVMELIKNCRVSYTDLAKKYQVSVNTIKNRVQSLQEMGVIGKFTVEFNPLLLNLNLIIIMFKINSPLENSTIEKLGNHPFIFSIGIWIETGFAVANYRNNTEISLISELFSSIPELDDITMFPVLPALTINYSTPKGSIDDLKQIDWNLLHYFRENGRISLSELSKLTQISIKTIRKRVQYLIDVKFVDFTILPNPGMMKKGIMTLYTVKLKKLTRQIRLEIDTKMQQLGTHKFWASWQIVDRPQIILAFQIQNTNEIEFIKDTIRKTIPSVIEINSIIGGRMTYYPTFVDELLKKKSRNDR